jgi:hypothetical protein
MADIIADGTIGAKRFLLLDSTGKIPAVDGSQVTALAAGNVATDIIPIARIDVGTTANKLVQLDANAKLPALDASLLTNIPGATKSSSDPAIDTNPSGGVGTEWHNTTSGEAYICTDATAGANVWINVGDGTGNIEPWVYQGTTYGYSVGGYLAPNRLDIIARNSFTTDGGSVDVGDIVTPTNTNSCSKSETHGYHSGGYATASTTSIGKWSFASAITNAVNVADLALARHAAGQASTVTHGYHVGGITIHTGAAHSVADIQKYATSTDSDAVSVADIHTGMTFQASCQSATEGYMIGGHAGSPISWVGSNQIQKFSLVSDGTGTDVSDLPHIRSEWGGTSSETHGYAHGGYHGGNRFDDICKYQFATSNNATDVASLSRPVGENAGAASSTTNGYMYGGRDASGYSAIVEKYSHITNTNGSNIGNLTSAMNSSSGIQDN